MKKQRIVISIKDLEKAFLEWNDDLRCNPDKYETRSEMLSKSTKEVAKDSAWYLWELITR